MRCKCCGRATAPAAGQATRCVTYYAISPGAAHPVAPWEDPLAVLAARGSGVIVAEVTCFRCFAWGRPGTPVFGKLYATR